MCLGRVKTTYTLMNLHHVDLTLHALPHHRILPVAKKGNEVLAKALIFAGLTPIG